MFYTNEISGQQKHMTFNK